MDGVNRMQGLFNIINIPFGYLMRFLAMIFNGNFAAAVFFFTLIINVILIPLTLKSQKSTVQQTRIKPKLDELKKRYGDDKQRYSQEMQKLYQAEGVSMGGGCLPMILRLVLMMSIYYLIMAPLTYLANADASMIAEAAKAAKLNTANTSYELQLVTWLRDNPSLFPELQESLKSIDLTLFGLDLTQTPNFSFDFSKAQAIWAIPFGAFLAQILTSVVSMKMNKKNNPDAPTMAGMMLTMPLISLFIGFGLPGGVGFYWICSSLVGGAIQVAVQYFYGPFRMLSKERAKEVIARCDFEATQLKKLGDVEENSEE